MSTRKVNLSNIVMWPVKDLTPYEMNAKKHGKEQVAKIAQAITNFGWADAHAIIVNEHGVILSGHGRRLAAIELGLPEVKVQVLSHMTPEQEKAFRLADNRVAISDIDTDVLNAELSDLSINLKGIFDDKELDFMRADLGAMNTDAFVEDMGTVLEDQKAEIEEMSAAATNPDERVPLAKAFGFKDISADGKFAIASLMSKIEGRTGLKDGDALVSFAKSFESTATAKE